MTGGILRHERAQAMVDRYLRMTINELTADLSDSHPAWEIAQQANVAFRQLSGSISTEALPEMVGRLVRVRLSSEQPADHPLAS